MYDKVTGTQEKHRLSDIHLLFPIPGCNLPLNKADAWRVPQKGSISIASDRLDEEFDYKWELPLPWIHCWCSSCLRFIRWLAEYLLFALCLFCSIHLTYMCMMGRTFPGLKNVTGNIFSYFLLIISFVYISNNIPLPQATPSHPPNSESASKLTKRVIMILRTVEETN